MTTPAVALAGEGVLDLAVLRRLVRDAGLAPGPEHGLRGKNHLDQRMRAFNAAAAYGPWVVARDMDFDAACPGALARGVLPTPARLMCYRIAVRSVECWLLADVEGFSTFFKVAPRHIADDPEALASPKAALLSALAQGSKDIRQAAVRVTPDGSNKPGPEYNATLAAFVASAWRPGLAQKSAPSLRKARARIKELARLYRADIGGS